MTLSRVLRFLAGPLAALATTACGGSVFTTAADDGGVATDAGGVGAPDGSGPADAGSHWCATRAELFCEDFDEVTSVSPLLGSWSTFEQQGGTFSLDTSGAPSPPNALQARGGSNAQVLLVKTFAALSGKPKLARLEFALRINAPGNVGGLSAAGFAAIAYGTKITDGYAALAIGNGPVISAAWGAPSGGVADAGAFQAANAKGAFPAPQTWAGRYAIEIDYGVGTNGNACAQIFQGPSALLDTCLPLPASLSDPSVLSVALGDYAAGFGNTGNVDLEFDDVTFSVAY